MILRWRTVEIRRAASLPAILRSACTLSSASIVCNICKRVQAYERCKQEVDNRAQRERQTLAIAKAVLSDPDSRAAIISQQRCIRSIARHAIDTLNHRDMLSLDVGAFAVCAATHEICSSSSVRIRSLQARVNQRPSAICRKKTAGAPSPSSERRR